MQLKSLPLSDLHVNKNNDRHGELENETAAIAWLFNNHEAHMKNLAKDIVGQSKIYEPPLVSPAKKGFTVYDGNRRVTCLKILAEPKKAPTTELQKFFQDLKSQWNDAHKFPESIPCQIETNKDEIDEILFRRHTGTQGGIGQSKWDDRIIKTFVDRTGRGGKINVAEEIENILNTAGLVQKGKKIPRTNLNRLLSAAPYHSQVGFSVQDGSFKFTHNKEKVIPVLSRIASDLVNKKIVLGDIWDKDGKAKYLKALSDEGILPTDKDLITRKSAFPAKKKPEKKAKPAKATKPTLRKNLIPHNDYGLTWPGRLKRHQEIWYELQFNLEFDKHPNSISVLFRVLIEFSIQNYIDQEKPNTIKAQDSLAVKLVKVAAHMHEHDKIDDRELNDIKKFQNKEQIFSIDTLNRYVHSYNLSPSAQHMAAMWDSLSHFIVLCLKA